MERAINYIQNKYNNCRHLLKTSFHFRVKHKNLNKRICFTNSWWQNCAEKTFMISLWIVNRFEKHILRIRNIASLLQWLVNPLTDLAQSISRTVRAQNVLLWPVRRRHQLRYQLLSVEGRAKCPTVPQRCEFLIGIVLNKTVNK